MVINMDEDKRIIGYITNPEDRANLEFILTATGEELKQWNAVAEEHDIDYALELMNAYAMELQLYANEQYIEAQLESMNDDYVDAKAILALYH